VSYGSGDLCKQRKKLQKKANEFYKLAHNARRNMFLCPGPAEEPSTIEDDANTSEAKEMEMDHQMSKQMEMDCIAKEIELEKAKAEVQRAANGQQVPWSSSTLR
jgi:hypothetical protein